MGPITSAIPRPRCVRVAGRDLPVWEARLADLADLQSRYESTLPGPLDGLAERVRGLPAGPERDSLLFDALEAVHDGPPPLDSIAGWTWLNTPDGMLAMLSVALGRSGLTPDAFAALLDDGPSFAEFEAIRGAFFGLPPERPIALMLGVPPAGGTPGRSLSWGEVFAEFAEKYGWTRDQIADLTVSEVAAYRRGGAPSGAGEIHGDFEFLTQLQARRQAAEAWKAEKEAASG